MVQTGVVEKAYAQGLLPQREEKQQAGTRVIDFLIPGISRRRPLLPATHTKRGRRYPSKFALFHTVIEVLELIYLRIYLLRIEALLQAGPVVDYGPPLSIVAPDVHFAVHGLLCHLLDVDIDDK